MLGTPVIARSSIKAGYWGTQTREPGTDEVTVPAGLPKCWGLTARYGRTTPTGTREDDVTTGLRIAKQPGGNLFTVGLTSELSAIETLLDTFFTAVAAVQSSEYTLAEYIWHLHSVTNPAAIGGGEKTGPAIRRTPKAIAGATAAERLPDQVASTITLQTASRRHWGRLYIPAIKRSAIVTTTGRISTGTADALALAMRNLVNSLTSAGYEAGVWSYKYEAFLPVWQVAVDDVPDIQRRRRVKQRAYRRLYAA